MPNSNRNLHQNLGRNRNPQRPRIKRTSGSRSTSSQWEHRQSMGCSCTLTPVKQGNYPKVEAPQSQSVKTRVERATMKSRRQRTNPHKELAECRRKKQSMSCFFGRRAGNPSAIIRKRSIVHAIAGSVEVQQCRGQPHRKSDKDPQR